MATGAAPGWQFPAGSPRISGSHKKQPLELPARTDAMHEIILKGVKKYECSQDADSGVRSRGRDGSGGREK